MLIKEAMYTSHFPDPSLTPDNIMKIVCRIPLWESKDSYYHLGMPENQHNESVRKFADSEEIKRELFTAWLADHPCPTCMGTCEMCSEI